jgi:serine/threonine-protein kinase RsbW
VSSLRPPRRIPVLAAESPQAGERLLTGAWPSELARKQEIIDGVVGVLNVGGYLAAEDEPMLCICLDEAIVNAIRHGNRFDAAKSVRVRVALEPERWVVVAEDDGDGFDPNEVPDPTSEAGLMAESGRGVRIMNAWLDELAYYRGGRTILMARRRADR